MMVWTVQNVVSKLILNLFHHPSKQSGRFGGGLSEAVCKVSS